MMTKSTSKKRSKQPRILRSLPDELVGEILSRLPTKSLARFRCVSKTWISFISHISSMQRRMISPPVSGFFVYPSIFCLNKSGPEDFTGTYVSIAAPHHHNNFVSRLASLPFHPTFHVIHSCNGLLLFQRRQLSRQRSTSDIYYVWNPSTMDVVFLPKRQVPQCGSAECFLAFDPRQSPHYKVIRFTGHNSRTIVSVEIYSSIIENWLDDERFTAPYMFPIPSFVKYCRGHSVFHQGALYFLLCNGHLVSFSIEKKNFQHLMLPKNISTARQGTRELRLPTATCIGVSNDRLHYAANLVNLSELRIYMLLEENKTENKWLLMHKVNTQFHPLIIREPDSGTPAGYHLQPIAFHPESEVIYLSTPGKILSYLPSSGMLKEVCKFHNYNYSVKWDSVFAVIPCLDSVNPPGGAFVEPLALETITSSK